MLKREVMQSSVEGAYAEEERRTLALSYLIRNLFEARSLDECLDVAIKGLSMLDFFQSQISLLEDGNLVVKRNHMDKKYQILLEQIWGRKFLGHKIDTRTSFASHLLDSEIVTTADIKGTVRLKLEDFIKEYLLQEWRAGKRFGMVTRVASIIPKKIDLLMFPLNYRGKVIGALGISGTSLRREDFLFLRNLCELFAQAFEKVQTKDELRKSEEKYRQLVENLGEGIWVIDKDAYTTLVNPRMAEMLGYTVDEMQGKHLFSFMDELGVEICKRNLERRKEGIAEQHDFEFLRKDGTRVYTRLETSPITDDGGNYIGALASVMDITERKQMEKALERQRNIAVTLSGARDLIEAVNRLFDNLLEIEEFDCAGFYLVDKDTGALDMIVHRGLPDRFVEKVGHLDADSPYAKVVMEGKPIYQKTSDFPPAIREDLQSDGILAVAAIPIHYKGEAIGDLNLASHTHDEISAFTRHVLESIGAQIGETIVRARMEDALRKSEEKFRSIFESANDCLIYLDMSGRILDVNGKAVEVFGGSKEELLGKHFTKVGLFSLRDIPTLMSAFAKGFAGKKATLNICIKNKKGQEIPLECSTSIMKIDDKLAGMLVIARDVSEREKAEEALRESEERLSQLIEYAPDAIYINDLKGNFIDGNKQAEKLTGYKKEELIGKNFLKIGLLPKRYVPKAIKALMKNALRQKTGPDEFELIRKDGRRVAAEISTFSVKRRGKIEVIGIARDITERKEMENKLKEYMENLEMKVQERTRELRETHERLLKSEKLAAIGEVAAMVGHDLRNPLQSIENATYYLNNELSGLPSSIQIPGKAKEMLQVINDSVNYADKIIRDLHEFSATKKPALEKTSINAIVKETLSKVEAPENVQLLTDLGHLPEIKADKDMIKRVFLNLALNGVQAMENGGRLKVSTRKTKGFVEVIFRDTGVGMSKKNMEKLFTPFFTTKAKGMGMGLAICKRFAESHGGSIDVESEEGKGSTFTVKLPIQQKSGGEKA